MRLFASITILSLLSACALVDGLSSPDDTSQPCTPGDPECNPNPQHTCSNPLQVGGLGPELMMLVNTCGQDPKPLPVPLDDVCGPFGPPLAGDSPAMVMELQVQSRIEVEMCVFSSSGPFQLGVATSCAGGAEPNQLTCLAPDACTVVGLDPGPHSLFWRGSHEFGCGELILDFRAVGTPGVETNCSDAIDNDGNGAIDCEDPACQGTMECSAMANEICNGVDDGPVIQSLPDLVDEFACPCLADSDCDAVFTGDPMIGYICHANNMPLGAVCAPSCQQLNWCPAFGLMCTTSGTCL